MNFTSGNRSSLAELKQRNPPPEPMAQAIMETPSESGPARSTAEEWAELMASVNAMGEILAEQVILLEELSAHLGRGPTAVQTANVQTQLKEIVAELKQTRSLQEQAGKKRERHFSFHRITLPRPSPAWLFLPLALAALWVLQYAWGVLWNTIGPLLL